MPSGGPLASLDPPLPGMRAGAHQQSRLRVAMGTWVAIEAVSESQAIALAGIEAAVAAVADVEARMHPLRDGSDVQRINTASPGGKCAIDASTWRVLTLAQRVHAASDGIFDPCLPIRCGRLSDLELSPAEAHDSAWVTCHAPVALDLGGIAKGYAIDRAVEALFAAGCDAGLVNAGGDLRVFGTHHQTILLRHADATYRPIAVQNGALAVSDLDAASRPLEHRGYYVRSGQITPRRRYAAVLAGEAAVADALTKCALLGSPEAARRTYADFGGREAL